MTLSPSCVTALCHCVIFCVVIHILFADRSFDSAPSGRSAQDDMERGAWRRSARDDADSAPPSFPPAAPPLAVSRGGACVGGVPAARLPPEAAPGDAPEASETAPCKTRGRFC